MTINVYKEEEKITCHKTAVLDFSESSTSVVESSWFPICLSDLCATFCFWEALHVKENCDTLTLLSLWTFICPTGYNSSKKKKEWREKKILLLEFVFILHWHFCHKLVHTFIPLLFESNIMNQLKNLSSKHLSQPELPWISVHVFISHFIFLVSNVVALQFHKLIFQLQVIPHPLHNMELIKTCTSMPF